jgi:hypothetical protein
MKTRAVSLAIVMLGATGVAFADQDDHHWERDHDHYKGHGWSDQRNAPVQAPEIDPSSIVAALTLLGGGLVVLRSRGTKNSKD